MIKDWNKINGILSWAKNEDNKTIYLDISGERDEWIVTLENRKHNSNNSIGYPKTLKEFKTKSQAMAYAKAYMRKH